MIRRPDFTAPASPDALHRAIGTLKEITPGRLICVFGAGGDRDQTKRPLMGRAASAADIAVVTSDNPRSERPEGIIAHICRGFAATRRPDHIEADREQAIAWAIRQARPGDCVLVAGKGHEQVQVIGNQRIPFDDRIVCRQWLMQSDLVHSSERRRVGA